MAVECLRQTGFMFLYAPALHPAMKRVQPIRRTLGFRTLFNLAGPLTNPAGARAQVVGVFAAGALTLVAETLARLDVRHAFVVHGRDGLDELTLNGLSDVAEVREQTVRNFVLQASDAGLEQAPLSALAGCDARGNAMLIERSWRARRGRRGTGSAKRGGGSGHRRPRRRFCRRCALRRRRDRLRCRSAAAGAVAQNSKPGPAVREFAPCQFDCNASPRDAPR